MLQVLTCFQPNLSLVPGTPIPIYLLQLAKKLNSFRSIEGQKKYPPKSIENTDRQTPRSLTQGTDILMFPSFCKKVFHSPKISIQKIRFMPLEYFNDNPCLESN